MSLSSSARLLRIISIAYIGIGLVWVTAAFAPIDLPARLLFDLLNWPLGEPLPTLDRGSRWGSAVGAGLLVGLALQFLLVVAPEIERGNRRVVRGSVIALGGWFVVDSLGSVASGVASNVLWNVPFLLGWLLPLLLVREHADAAIDRGVPPEAANRSTQSAAGEACSVSNQRRVTSSAANISSTPGASTST